MMGSLIIVGFFIIGILTGYEGLIPESLLSSDMSFVALCALMFCVGISIGADAEVLQKFKRLDPKLLLLPLVTIIGTLLGSAVLTFILSGRSLTDCLSVGSGFGYYSLSSIIITQYKGPELGTIALLANISREIITLLLAPFIACYFGRLAPISTGGATSMDTTLPIITRASGEEFVIVSIYHGVVLTYCVPLLVSFFCSI